MLSTFFSVTYEDLALEERCARCWCCSNCQDKCGCVADETTDGTLMRVLGLLHSEALIHVGECRKNFEKEEEREFGKICERKVGAKGNADSTDESDD